MPNRSLWTVRISVAPSTCLLLLAVACGGGGDGGEQLTTVGEDETFGGPGGGGEGEPCLPDGTCDEGLYCVDSECVASDGTCGNDILDDGEECDEGEANSNLGPSCTESCTLPVCGDGFPQPGEECDDANDVPGDGCNPGCLDSGCGDGFAEMGGEFCHEPLEAITDYAVASRAEAGDLDGDGDLDLVMLTDGSITVLFNDGNGESWAPSTIGAGAMGPIPCYAGLDDPAGNQRALLHLEELTGDDDLDLIYVTCNDADPYTTTLHLAAGDGMGGFTDVDTETFDGLPRQVTTVDHNWNGRSDVALLLGTRNANQLLAGDLIMIPTAGDGSLNTPVTIDTGLGLAIDWMAVGDLTEDGHDDLLVDGAAYRSTGAAYSPIVNTDLEADFGLLVDYEGSESLDAVLLDQSGVQVWRGNGMGFFQTSGTEFDIGFNDAATAVADFDVDGDLDVIVVDSSGVDVMYFVLGADEVIEQDTAAGAATIADFNDDGAPDVLMADWDGNRLVFHLSQR